MKSPLKQVISVAPMMAYTDRHFRYLLRIISQQTILYTEMVTANAVIHGNHRYLLEFSPEEHPVILQLGGADPNALAQAAKIGAQCGYDAINLNVGCPSNRVQQGCFGVALMKNPALVAECFQAMQAAVDVPVNIKTRLGVDEYDSESYLHDFIGTISEAGCQTVIMHARKAWLKGLSPKENRHVPPLQYDRVYDLKRKFPHLEIIVNGGVQTLEEAQTHLQYLDGVMLGRAVCASPYLLATVDQRFYGAVSEPLSREAVVKRYMSYASEQQVQGVPLKHMMRHLIGLFQGQPGARAWRRSLSGNEKK